MLSAAMVVPGLLAAAGPVVDAQLRAEGRAGSPVTNGAASTAAIELDPSVLLQSGGGEVTAELSYLPRLLAGATGTNDSTLLHRGRATLNWMPERTRRITLDQQLQVGTMDFSPLLQQTQPVDPRLATVQSLPFLSSTTSLAWTERFDRRWSLTANGAWVVSGGLDAEAQKTLPQLRGPQAAAEVRYAASAVDELAFTADGSHATYTDQSVTTLARTSAVWRRRLDTGTRFELSGGAGAASARDGSAVGPVASAALDTVLHETRRLGASARVSLAPVLDPLGGSFYERVDALATLGWGATPSLSLAFSGGGSRSLQASATPGAASSVIATEGRAVWAVDKRFGVSAGVRAMWLRDAGGLPPFQWTGFVSLAAQLQEGL